MSASNIIMISASARQDGDTAALVSAVKKLQDIKHINLLDYKFSYYDYTHQNRDDDFIYIIDKVLAYHTIIFVTPVYWYSMSGLMKVFFDRMSDLLKIEKDKGRQLRGKRMAVLTTSNGSHLGNDFWHPFKHTAKYLGMDYLDGLHTVAGIDYQVQLESFIKKIAS